MMTRISEVANRPRQCPFELSVGLLHRSMIAMSVACEVDHPEPFDLHARCWLNHESREADAADVYRKAVGIA